MMIYALRWPIDRPHGDEVSDGFFRHARRLWSSEALDHEAPLSLPTSEHPIVAAAMAYTKEHLQIGDRRRGEPCRRGVGTDTATALPRRTRIVVAHLSAARPHAAGDGAAGRRRGSRCRRRRRRSVSTASVRSLAHSHSSAARPRRPTAKGLPANRFDCSVGVRPEQAFPQKHGDGGLPSLKLRGTCQRLG